MDHRIISNGWMDGWIGVERGGGGSIYHQFCSRRAAATSAVRRHIPVCSADVLQPRFRMIRSFLHFTVVVQCNMCVYMHEHRAVLFALRAADALSHINSKGKSQLAKHQKCLLPVSSMKNCSLQMSLSECFSYLRVRVCMCVFIYACYSMSRLPLSQQFEILTVYGVRRRRPIIHIKHHTS